MAKTIKTDPITLGPVMLSFPHFFVAQSVQGGEPKYNGNIIFGEDLRTILQAQIDWVAATAFPDTPYDVIAKKMPIHPCQSNKNYQDLPGQFFCNIKATCRPDKGQDYPPKMIHYDRTPIIDPLEIKAGNLAYVIIYCYSTDHPLGGQGVSIGVNAVMKYTEGTPRAEGASVDLAKAFEHVPPPPQGAANPMPPTPPQGAANPMPPTPPQGAANPMPPTQTAPTAGYAPPAQPAAAPPGQPAVAQPAAAYPSNAPAAPPPGYVPPVQPQPTAPTPAAAPGGIDPATGAPINPINFT